MNYSFMSCEGVLQMNERIKAITDAATLLFLQQGYSKTQISHIAKAVGVSVGTIYLNFAGKKEIMHFILKHTIAPDFMERDFELPITEEIFVGLEQDIVTLFEKLGDDFASHLNDDVSDYGFDALISDAFDLLAKYAIGCLFIEKNQFDFPFLAEHYKKYRRRFLETMTQYVERFIETGVVRPLEHVELSTTLIIEILSWWAMDMRYTSFELQDIPLEQAKRVCLDNVISAYQCKN